MRVERCFVLTRFGCQVPGKRLIRPVTTLIFWRHDTSAGEGRPAAREINADSMLMKIFLISIDGVCRRA